MCSAGMAFLCDIHLLDFFIVEFGGPPKGPGGGGGGGPVITDLRMETSEN